MNPKEKMQKFQFLCIRRSNSDTWHKNENLKSHKFWPNFEKSSFLPIWKTHQFWVKLEKSLFFYITWKIINYGQILKNHYEKIINFCWNLKNHHFLHKSEKFIIFLLWCGVLWCGVKWSSVVCCCMVWCHTTPQWNL